MKEPQSLGGGLTGILGLKRRFEAQNLRAGVAP